MFTFRYWWIRRVGSFVRVHFVIRKLTSAAPVPHEGVNYRCNYQLKNTRYSGTLLLRVTGNEQGSSFLVDTKEIRNSFELSASVSKFVSCMKFL